MTARQTLEARCVRLANELSEALQKLEHVECDSKDSPDSWPLLDDIRHARDLAVDCQDTVNSLLLSNRENAAFIVRACNSHAELLEALRRIRNNASGRRWNTLDRVDELAFGDIVEQAEAAIRKATQ